MSRERRAVEPKRWYRESAWVGAIASVAAAAAAVITVVALLVDRGDTSSNDELAGTLPAATQPTSALSTVDSASSTTTTTTAVRTTTTTKTVPPTTTSVVPATTPLVVVVIDPPPDALSPVPAEETQVAAAEPRVNSDASIDGTGAGCMYGVSSLDWVYLRLKGLMRISRIEIAFSDDVAAGYRFAAGALPEAVEIEVKSKVDVYKNATFDLPAPVESNLVAIKSSVPLCDIRFK